MLSEGLDCVKSTTDQIFHSTVDNFTGVGTADKNDCTRILDFLRFAGFQGAFRSRILGLSDCKLTVNTLNNTKMRAVTNTTRSITGKLSCSMCLVFHGQQG